jgi:helix-turn-helix protein
MASPQVAALETIVYAARRLRTTEAHIYGLIRKGILPPGVVVRIASRWLINPALLEEFLATGGSNWPAKESSKG